MRRWLVCLWLCGCLQATSVDCADGTLCPAGTQCGPDGAGCVTQAQRDACGGKPDGATCALAGAGDAACRGQVCRAIACGNGFIEGLEQCDGAALGAHTCETEGYYGGTIACTPSCTLDLSLCTGKCGDSTINGGEACDGTPLDGKTCSHFGDYAPDGL